MYFWKIDKLKGDLISGPLPPPEQFRYLLAESLLMGLVTIPFLTNNWFDVLNGIIMFLIIGFGTYYIYRCNGGAAGERLLERYFSLSWVVFVRMLVLVFLPALVVHVMLYEAFSELPEETGLPDVVFTVLLVLVFYYILGKHIRSVRKHAT